MVDSDQEMVISPFAENADNRKLAHAMLDGLWAEAAYRDNMAAWLSTNHANVVEDLLFAWQKNYHRAFVSSVEFLDPEVLSILFRLGRANAIYSMDRQNCQVQSEEQITGFVNSAKDKLIKDHIQQLSTALPKAMTREFARQNKPKAGDRPIPEFMAEVARTSLFAIAKTWPPEDEKRIVDHFSYGKKKKSLQDYCEAAWVVSHAIHDAKVEDPARQTSASLLRQSITQTALDEMFARIDAPLSQSRPTSHGFKPGKSAINYPVILSNNRAVGDTEFTIDIDETGKAGAITLTRSTIQPALLLSMDGSSVTAAAVLAPVVDAYYRAGMFPPREVEGKPVPYTVKVHFAWTVK